MILCPHIGNTGVHQFPPLGVFDKAFDDINQWMAQELKGEEWTQLHRTGTCSEKDLYNQGANVVKIIN